MRVRDQRTGYETRSVKFLNQLFTHRPVAAMAVSDVWKEFILKNGYQSLCKAFGRRGFHAR